METASPPVKETFISKEDRARRHTERLPFFLFSFILLSPSNCVSLTLEALGSKDKTKRQRHARDTRTTTTANVKEEAKQNICDKDHIHQRPLWFPILQDWCSFFLSKEKVLMIHKQENRRGSTTRIHSQIFSNKKRKETMLDDLIESLSTKNKEIGSW